MPDSKWFLMSVLETKPEGEQFVSLKLAPELENFRFDFRPGQYVKISHPETKREGIFSIASEPDEKQFVEFLVKNEPEGLAPDLNRVTAGDRLRISAPMGKGYPLERLYGKNILLIGMGSGLSPLRSVLKSILRREHQFGKVALVYGARNQKSVPYEDDFYLWSKKINVQLALSKPDQTEWSGFLGRVTSLLPSLRFEPQKTIACVCGSRAMEKEVKEILEQAGFKKENILVNY